MELCCGWSIVALLCACLGAAIGRARGNETLGLLVGGLLGPLGVLIACFLPPAAAERRPARGRPPRTPPSPRAPGDAPQGDDPLDFLRPD